MIGRVIGCDAPRHFCGIGVAVLQNIALYDAAVRQLHHQSGIVRPPVEIDPKPRPAAQQGRRPIDRGQGAGERSRPNVIGDVSRQQAGVQPQPAFR